MYAGEDSQNGAEGAKNGKSTTAGLDRLMYYGTALGSPRTTSDRVGGDADGREEVGGQ